MIVLCFHIFCFEPDYYTLLSPFKCSTFGFLTCFSSIFLHFEFCHPCQLMQTPFPKYLEISPLKSHHSHISRYLYYPLIRNRDKWSGMLMISKGISNLFSLSFEERIHRELKHVIVYAVHPGLAWSQWKNEFDF